MSGLGIRGRRSGGSAVYHKVAVVVGEIVHYAGAARQRGRHPRGWIGRGELTCLRGSFCLLSAYPCL